MSKMKTISKMKTTFHNIVFRNWTLHFLETQKFCFIRHRNTRSNWDAIWELNTKPKLQLLHTLFIYSSYFIHVLFSFDSFCKLYYVNIIGETITLRGVILQAKREESMMLSTITLAWRQGRFLISQCPSLQ